MPGIGSTGKKSRIGALAVLSTCFVASAIIRAGEVVAALPAAEEPEPSASAPATVGTPVADARGPAELIAELQRQRELLDAREKKLELREQRLDALETTLRERLAEIRMARERLAETAALVDDAAGKDVQRLALMYQQMKPKQAGQIFDRMAPPFAAGFIAEMRPEAAALILANMEAEKAYAVTLLLAGRNVKPGGEVAAGSD